MTFPETRLTLIQRIASGGTAADWRRFFDDYWRPVFRFSARWGHLKAEDAEDVTSTTFEVLLSRGLLSRWVTERNARLRTLICTIVRNQLSNRGRIQSGRERLLREHGGKLDYLAENSEQLPDDASDDLQDRFCAAWAEDLLEKALEQLLAAYHREGLGDHFRILYGRICEGLTVSEIAEDLKISVTSVENHYRQARQRLAQSLEQQLRDHVKRYCPAAEIPDEFQQEWERLGRILGSHGGIEAVLNRARAEFDPALVERHQRRSLTTLTAKLPR